MADETNPFSVGDRVRPNRLAWRMFGRKQWRGGRASESRDEIRGKVVGVRFRWLVEVRWLDGVRGPTTILIDYLEKR